MTIDETFLTLHPATLEWFERRKNCETCANLAYKGSAMKCTAAPASHPHHRREFEDCIDARLDGQPCGPDAKLRVPA